MFTIISALPQKKEKGRLKKKIYGEHISLENCEFDYILVRGLKSAAAQRTINRLKHSRSGYIITPDQHLDPCLIERFIKMLNLNATLYIIKQSNLKSLTLYDPYAFYRKDLEKILLCVKYLKIITYNEEIYEAQNEICFKNTGGSAVITDSTENISCPFLLCTEALPPQRKPQNTLIIGGDGFNSDTSSISISPELTEFLRYNISPTDFLTALAIINDYSPIKNSIPKQLKNDTFSLKTNEIIKNLKEGLTLAR